MNPKVLIIEDRHDWASLLEKDARRMGCKAYKASTAVKAAELIKKYSFDAIVVDIRLEDWNVSDTSGLDFLESIPEKDRPPAIVITGYPEPEFIRKAFENCHVEDFLIKTQYTQRIFQNILRKVLRIRTERTRRNA